MFDIIAYTSSPQKASSGLTSILTLSLRHSFHNRKDLKTCSIFNAFCRLLIAVIPNHPRLRDFCKL